MPPLAKGSSQETIDKNSQEMMHSETFAEGKSRKKKLQMAQAAAYRAAGRSRRERKRRNLAKDAIRGDHS
ncbi:hypothetical protein AMJ85_00280 [candidate division BRC1 bacterium SM23_51]|nr:MAG: hypothetical protein AMJ85_00280 [candidate division BRC1 bacterium SM23_51]